MEIKKFGIIISLFLFTVVTFISGNLSQVNAASSSTVLPIAKGGTGTNTLSAGQALIGNGANSLQTKPIDTSPQSNSTNLITSGAVRTVANDSALAKGFDNIYFVNTTNNDALETIYLIGPTTTLDSSSPEYTIFSGEIKIFRTSYTSLPTYSGYHVWIANSYNKNISASVTLYGHAGINKRDLKAVTFNYNNVKYIGIYLSYGMRVNFILKGYLGTSIGCVSNSGLCTGRMFHNSEVSNITNI
jgi:hypothetical protein